MKAGKRPTRTVKNLPVRLSESERDDIRRRAMADGDNVSGFVRRKLGIGFKGPTVKEPKSRKNVTKKPTD